MWFKPDAPILPKSFTGSLNSILPPLDQAQDIYAANHIVTQTTPTLTQVSDTKAPYFWGVDIGGTGIKLGLVDSLGKTLAYDKMPTREPEGAEAALQRVAKSMHAATQKLGLAADDVKAVGLGAPGPMDLPAGTLVAPPQLPGWWGFNVRDCLSKLSGLPVSFLNDANAAAYGEFWLGSGKTMIRWCC